MTNPNLPKGLEELHRSVEQPVDDPQAAFLNAAPETEDYILKMPQAGEFAVVRLDEDYRVNGGVFLKGTHIRTEIRGCVGARCTPTGVWYFTVHTQYRPGVEVVAGNALTNNDWIESA